VLLDMGGVVVDLGEGRGLPTGDADREGRRALARAVEAAGGRLPPDARGPDVMRHHGGGWEGFVERRLLAPWRLGYGRRYQRGAEEPWEPHLARFRSETGAALSDEALLAAWFEPFGEAIPALPGAREALDRLRRMGPALGLVSNVPLPGSLYRRVLERHRLLAPFDALRFSHDAGVRKPCPEMLLQVLEELGTPPEEAVMVGDRRDSDIAAGRAAGTVTVLLGGGRRGAADDGPDDGPEPDLTLGSIAELPEALARLDLPRRKREGARRAR
jgi:HAD superfamily hydrolase (TIGR01549 family)